MIIWRFKPVGTSNFGDALNEYLWPKFLSPKIGIPPGYFYGIGTVLGANMPPSPRHLVFGAGVGYAGVPSIDSSWDIRFVRGPMTAANMGGCPFITDPGILVSSDIPRSARRGCSFLPRWDTINDDLIDACQDADITVIDPRWPVQSVIDEIARCNLLLTEALHGAVVADTLRVPWISIYASPVHDFKWRDWMSGYKAVWNPIDMAEFTLSWARDYAVPQLMPLSLVIEKKDKMMREIDKLNVELEAL